jgi:cis-L-3-hydroxyproline dehydratase
MTKTILCHDTLDHGADRQTVGIGREGRAGRLMLDPKQESILRGDSGEALALAMKTLVRYGEACGARRLVPIKSAHLAGSFGIVLFEAYYLVLERLVAAGVRVVVPATTNPAPGVCCDLFNWITYFKQRRLDRALKALGVTLSNSCVCYDGVNVPSFGDRLAWSESSAVQYANSVLGARTNRNSILVDVCSAVTGFTPEFGCLLDERRRGQVLVRLEIERMDASALGFVVGRRLVNRIPVFEHHDFSPAELKNLGGGLATSSAIDMFHVEGLTPEAPDLRTAFGGELAETLTITQEDLDSLRGKDGPRARDVVVFGCPQMTLGEAVALSGRFAGTRVRCPTWFCLSPHAAEQFERTDAFRAVLKAGVQVHTCCPLAALSVRWDGKRILTPSTKLGYYLNSGKYGSLDDCLSACGVNS